MAQGDSSVWGNVSTWFRKEQTPSPLSGELHDDTVPLLSPVDSEQNSVISGESNTNTDPEQGEIEHGRALIAPILPQSDRPRPYSSTPGFDSGVGTYPTDPTNPSQDRNETPDIEGDDRADQALGLGNLFVETEPMAQRVTFSRREHDNPQDHTQTQTDPRALVRPSRNLWSQSREPLERPRVPASENVPNHGDRDGASRTNSHVHSVHGHSDPIGARPLNVDLEYQMWEQNLDRSNPRSNQENVVGPSRLGPVGYWPDREPPYRTISAGAWPQRRTLGPHNE